HVLVVLAVVGQAQPAPENRASHRWTIEHPADRHGGDAYAVTPRDVVQRRKELLEQLPAAPRVHHLLVFPEADRVERGAARIGLVQKPLRQETAARGAIGKQVNAMFATEGYHANLRAAVD